METFKGGCHCGAVTFEVSMTLGDVIECNCSHCTIKGLLLVFVSKEQFTLHSGEDALSEYRFHKKMIAHQFCKHCGVESFAQGTGKDGKSYVAINMRALPGVTLSELHRVPFDGKSW